MQYLTRNENDELDYKKCQKIINKIVKNLKKFANVAIVGMSGGADSTLVSILCVLAFGNKNVFGIELPHSQYDINFFNKRSNYIKNKLNLNCDAYSINIKEIIKSFIFSFNSQSIELSILNLGNMKSRVRMIVLYTINQYISEILPNKRCRVIGTGNLSEDFIGYDTKFGDSAADIFPIGDLYKQEVYDLLDYFKYLNIIDEECIDRIPSAGLWEGQTDQQELKYSYNEMALYIDKILKNEHKSEDFLKNDIARFVLEMHEKNKHKHLASPKIKLR